MLSIPPDEGVSLSRGEFLYGEEFASVVVSPLPGCGSPGTPPGAVNGEALLSP